MNNSLRLSKLESVRKSLDVLTSFLAPCLPFINAHNVDFFVKSYWNQFLPHKLREDLEQLPVSSKLLKSYVDSLSSGSWRNSDKPLREDVSFHNCTLHELVQKIGELGLENMKMSIPLDEIPFLQSEAEDRAAIKLDIGVAEAELQFDKFMSSKKMHEVETMSYLIYRAAKAAGEQRKESSGNGLENVDDGTDTPERNPLGKRIKVGKLIDFGSGKGYLSSFLALLYKFRIFALDSSSGNTTAATERGERLQRVWLKLVRRAAERARTGACISTRRKTGKNVQNGDPEDFVDLEDKSRQRQRRLVDKNEEISDKLINCLHLHVHRNLDLDQLIQNSHDSGFGIVGLHTCGVLGVDSIHLFLQHQNASFLCNVPCCYHHCEEIIFPSTPLDVNSPHSRLCQTNPRQSPFWAVEDSAMTPEPTFPLSQHLQRQEFNLGRNARMLSSYSHARISKELETLDVDISLIWRLLLQVIINEKQGHTLLDYQVGRVGRRCTTFQEYVHKSLKKLHLDEIKVTDEEINEVYQRYEPHFQNFHSYYILRTMLAPLIESCILLDRLAFLLEQKSVVKDAFIVKVFDQFMSPRAHAIVAFKSKGQEKELTPDEG